ncbi:allophanate hydrolase subunit 2-domain-containing protein [Mycena olivaceomarginata]|nr:allophanate hydrolase subunit 2-domain-containing protein [Mycena olivaceomarginata]
MHKLLVANRGEIALRIIRTAKVQGIVTVAIYTSSDALSPHAYLSGSRIIALCQEHEVTMLHPGYGFLSENSAFAQAVLDVGIIWLGPKPDVIRTMGLKHLARDVAMKAGVTCVPGSEGLVPDAADARAIAGRIGFPVMLKASAGGGGMGMVVCADEDALAEAFSRTTQRAKELFDFDGVFLERYFPASRHIEIQIFGNGMGDIVCMGERECSIQRRHQKIIEESPSPSFATRPELRTRMCNAATRLAALVKYSSAGVVVSERFEFLVDDQSGDFYFLEMNTRIQVEHPVTEAIYPGLDLVRLMIQQGLAEADGLLGLATDSTEMQQSTYDALLEKGARAYAENPAADFRPCPGVLQYVNLPTSEQYEWLRIDTWISTGTQITPFFDPLLAKVVVSGQSRSQARSRMQDVLEESQILGSANNVEYLKAILASKMFQNGHATTRFLETFEYIPRAMTVISAAVDLSVQDFPGRQTWQGIPRSGPMDSMAFRSANILVDNPAEMEGLEMIILPGTQGIFKFHVPAVVAVAGKEVVVKVNGQEMQMWSSIIIPAGAQLSLSAKADHSGGLRTYLAIRGGFPIIPTYLGSKSTSMGFGGFQGRTLIPGDELGLAKRCGPIQTDVNRAVPPQFIPSYPSHCVIYVLAGPHDDEQFVTAEGISQFYEARWRVSPSSNRLGIRLEGPDKILWARTSGSAGGSHPSNILDNGYALGSINVNGNTPVILTNEGPDMGGYVCLCTVASAELWKLGQLSAGCTIEFRRISWVNAMLLHSRNESWLEHMGRDEAGPEHGLQLFADQPQNPKLFVVSGFPSVVLRQAGDSAILVEYGEMTLEFSLRARVHAFEAILKQLNIPGLLAFCPCVRSTMCHFDPLVIKQSDVISAILEAQRAVPESVEDMTFAGRRLTFPIVLDDQWSREALARYMGSIRDKAVYLPSNIDYLAKNNGFASSEQVLTALVASDWVSHGASFLPNCALMVDPRCRLVAQKMNPSRTYTPRGAVGIAGVVAAIYPAVSPGGYMLFGRTLPAWQQWGKGPNFAPDRPMAVAAVHFEPVREEQYLQIEKEFDAGRYTFRIEETIFSMAEYSTFNASITGEVAVFEAKQKRAELLENWELGKKVAVPESSSNNEVEGSTQITSPLFGNVWKICCQPGDVITSSDTTVAVLEAMKTEISITAGEANVGKTVKGVSKGIREGASVNPGDGLIVLH